MIQDSIEKREADRLAYYEGVEGGVFNENGGRLYVSTNQLWYPWDGSDLEWGQAEIDGCRWLTFDDVESAAKRLEQGVLF